METNACLKCGSTDVVPDWPLPDYHNRSSSVNRQVHIQETPENLIFKNTRRFSIRAKICGSCGFVEHYLKSPGMFYEIYQKGASDDD